MMMISAHKAIGCLLVAGLTGLAAPRGQAAKALRQAPDSSFPYRIGSQRGISAEPAADRLVLKGRDRFRLTLVPAGAEAWNMEQVSVLGLMLKNTGGTELILDLMLGNEGATQWSNSSLGRTIVKPGEEMPLGVALCRSPDYSTTHSAYLRMSGKPDGNFRHWHTIDPARVKNLVITCASEGRHAFELAGMVPLQTMNEDRMGRFPFIDRYGQYSLRSWPDKAASDGDLQASAAAEKALEEQLGRPDAFSAYGGWKEGSRFEATGYFHTKKHEGRWWFVDPEGYLFWSYGVNCVGVEFAGQTPTERNPAVFSELPQEDDATFGRFHTKLDVEDNYKLREDVPHYDFTRANLYRTYGKDWEAMQVGQDIRRLQYCRFNTIGAWSDNAVVALKKVPYTVMLHYEYAFAAEKLPDPFDPATRAGLREAICEYPVDFRNDPWCLGAFVNNELHWNNNARHMVAAVLGYAAPGTEVKKVFAAHLTEKYGTAGALNAAWQTDFESLDDLLSVNDPSLFAKANPDDCSELAFLLADAFYGLVKEELAAHSPNTLYLGSRMNSGSESVLKAAAKHVDVISANIYAFHPDTGHYGSTDKPVLITEFHFANVSGNNLGSGLRSAQDAVQQGRLFGAFISRAVMDPKIIGAHWFQWRDQNVGGRYDGENYDVGFFDVADRPNDHLIRAAAGQGQTLYNSIK
jgi:hypothetical protein